MRALTTFETSVLEIAHLVGITTVEHLVDESLIVGRVVAGTELFEALPVIDKDLFEDVPVPRRFDNHQIAPSEGGDVGDAAFLPHLTPCVHPSAVFTEVASPTSLALELRGLQETGKCKFLYDQVKLTVSLDVISLMASSCGYYRGHIEQHAAQ